MTDSKETNQPYILEIDIAGESLVLGINNVKDSLKVFNILAKNGYHVTISAVKTETTNKEKTDEELH